MKFAVSGIASLLCAGFAVTGMAGISGGGAAANGISGGGAAANGISGGGAAAELLLIGPVEAVDVASKTAVVLGQKLPFAGAESLSIGEMVAVYGAMRTDGALAVSSVQRRGSYVAGASLVYLSGIVQKVEPSVGRAVVNGVSIDLTPMMVNQEISPSIGSKLQVLGVQPVGHGVVLVNGISGGGAAANGISGGGAAANGISGGGAAANGISGGGAAANGISGGGAAANGIIIRGGRVNGISGGGAAANGIRLALQ